MKETRPAKTVHRGEQSLSAKVWFENGNRTDIATSSIYLPTHYCDNFDIAIARLPVLGKQVSESTADSREQCSMQSTANGNVILRDPLLAMKA